MTRLAVACPEVGRPSESFVRKHVQALDDAGAVVVAARHAPDANWHSPAEELLWDRPPSVFKRRQRRAFPSARAQAALARRLRDVGVGVVLCEYLDLSVSLVAAWRAAGIDVVAHGHGYDVSALFRSEEWASRMPELNACRAVVVPNRVAAARLTHRGVRPELVHVVPCGVDLTELPPRRMRQPTPAIRIVAVGRLVAKKAPLALLESVRKARVVSPVELDLYGDGPLMPAVRAGIERNRMGDYVRLHGAVSHHTALDAMAGADLFAQHSIVDPATGNEEGLPVAVLEAMALSLPVVATRHAGIPDAVDADTGVLVDEGDTDAMAAALIGLASDPDRRAALGAQARLKVESFTWNSERRALRELLGLSAAKTAGGPDTVRAT